MFAKGQRSVYLDVDFLILRLKKITMFWKSKEPPYSYSSLTEQADQGNSGCLKGFDLFTERIHILLSKLCHG